MWRAAIVALAWTPMSTGDAATWTPSMLQAQPPKAADLPKDVAAAAGDTQVPFAELDRLLLERHAMSDNGREALQHLLRARVLDRLALESKLEVSSEVLDRRTRELERELEASGERGGLAAYLERNNVTPSTFREFLRLGIVQETLARRALGIPEGKPVPAEQQEMWLGQVLQSRGVHLPTPPWDDGVAARCGDVSVSSAELAKHLRTQIASADVREDCFQLALEKRLRARMPDVAPQAVERALDAELARRKHEFESDPKHRGASWEQVMSASGVRSAFLREDPAVRIAALAHLWVDKTYGDEGLKRIYQEERSAFDGRFGEAFEVRILFLRAAVLTNELNPRTFEDAERDLGLLRAEIDGEAAFKRLAATRSEDPQSRSRDGFFDWIARGDARLPSALVDKLFRADDAPPSDAQRLIGPVRSQGGVMLAWIGAKRAAPPWSEMASYVHRDLRRRFLEETLRPQEVITFLDDE